MYIYTLKIIFKKTLTIVLFLTLLLVVITMVLSKIELFNFKSYVVLTGSMNPSIPQGSIIFTQKLNKYLVGDVITFKRGDQTITHRIVVIQGHSENPVFTTQGDANNVSDSQILSQKDILGKAIIKANHVGNLVIFIKTPLGFIALIVIPAFLLIGMELWNIKREIEKSVRKKVYEEVLGKNAFV